MRLTLKKRLYRLLKDSLVQAVNSGALPPADYPDVKIEYPREEKFGDYSTPFALEAARALKMNPFGIASALKTAIEKSPLAGNVEIVKPGFINIFISHEYLNNCLADIYSQKDRYGRSDAEQTEKINIEFVSANPTGPLNIVSARAAAIGDTLANLLEASGSAVDREFYVNDYGNQVDMFGRSIIARMRELRGEDSVFPEEGYRGEYVADIAAYINENFYLEFAKLSPEEQVTFAANKGIEYNLEGQKRDLDLFNVSFDRWFRESCLHAAGRVGEAHDFLESNGRVYTEDGKKVFRSTDYGDDKDRVIIRDDGRPTYLLADIAYHRDKAARGYDRIIDIWGPDHHGYIARMKAAMDVCGYSAEKFTVLIAQQVNLIQDGEAVKMSKRQGRFSTMKDLVQDVGVDASRFFFVMRSLDSHLDFDLDLAKRSSSENPVFYLQYAHARICSIFREAEKRGFNDSLSPHIPDFGENPEAVILMKLLVKFPEEIMDAARAFEPHRIASYLMKLAQSFHRFYTEHRVLIDDERERKDNLLLCECVRIVLKNGLSLLGVSSPDSM